MTVADTLDLIGKLVQTKCNEKKDWIDQHTKTLSELPLHKINDDIFDVDSEVLKSEKYWREFVLGDAIDDVKELGTIYNQYVSVLESIGKITGVLPEGFSTLSIEAKQKFVGASPSGGALPKVGATPSGAMNKTTGQLQHERGSLPKPNRVLDS